METNIIIIISTYVPAGLLDVFDINNPAISRLYADAQYNTIRTTPRNIISANIRSIKRKALSLNILTIRDRIKYFNLTISVLKRSR